eukprot:2554399-Pyramimonas_sp.AAC.1
MTVAFCDVSQANSVESGFWSRSVRRRLKVGSHWQAAVHSAAESISDLYGVRLGQGFSRAQREAHRHLAN